jgi:hypothetical protein
MEPALVGIHDASTFYGFCESHDSVLFRELEATAFEGTPRQLLLLNFRAITRRLYSTQAGLDINVLDGLDQGLPPGLQRWEFADLEDMRTSARESEKNLLMIKSINDAALTMATHEINGAVVRLSGRPEIAISALLDLPRDFHGQVLPRVPPPAHLSFHIIPTATGAVSALVWVGRNVSAEQLAHTLFALQPDVVPDVMLNVAIASRDLVFYSPQWWDSLGAATTSMIVDRATEFVRPNGRRDFDVGDRALRVSRLALADMTPVGDWSGR